MFLTINPVIKFFKNTWEHQEWGNDVGILFTVLIALVVIPAILSYVTYWLGDFVHVQLGKSLGHKTQSIVAGAGAMLHEFLVLVIGRIGGHQLHDTHFYSWDSIKKLNGLPAIDHDWTDHNAYETMCDFWIGTVPTYLAALLLFGIQYVLGGNVFDISVAPSSVSGQISGVKSMFFHSLTTAFSTGNFLASILFFIVVVLIASMAFSISLSEIRDVASGCIFWGALLAVIWFLFVFFGKVPLLMPYMWTVMLFSAMALAHIIVYLVVILIILLILRVITLHDIRKNN